MAYNQTFLGLMQSHILRWLKPALLLTR